MSPPAPLRAPTSSLERIFAEFASPVYRYARRRCGDDALAEDLTALAFEAASRNFARGRGDEVTLPWLVTVVQRRLIDHWRREARSEDRLERLRNEALVAGRGDGTTSSTEVMAALDALGVNQRAALVLRYLDDLSVSEVAEELGLTYKATESLLSRSRRAFSISYWEKR